ncbi:RNA polymerase sigma factor [Dinghuibacter silviterrae]|uniref:RNA polymerase sigma factor n=1 Tax=Dinghuibacter silviterrae TaxID=1539049 RepID=UPI0013C2AB53|nr:sigma-70 family RNA polymerase sigma factor [Dinghuibacter silviterrae]
MGNAFTFQADLVTRLKARDEAAFAEMYRNYSNAFLSIITKITNGDIEAAKDILQEAMVKVWNNIHLYDSSKGTLFTWVMNISRNTAIDKLRSKDFKNQLKNRSLETSEAQDYQPVPSLNTELIGVKKMLEKLDSSHRDVVDVVYMMGYSHAEAAEVLDIPLGTVKTRLRNAIVELRKQYRIA